VRAPLRGVALVAAILAAVVAIGGIAACARPQPRTNETRIQKLNEITTLWAQIRD
jgi:hypothetical protein